VIIQSYNPAHPIIQYVVRHDYHAYFMSQLTDRKKFSYPPYFRLINLRLKHRDQHVLNRAAKDLAMDLRADLGKRVLGPEYPLVSRIQNWYIKQILVKIERGTNVAGIKDLIRKKIEDLQKMPAYRQVKVLADVDPN